MLIFCFCKYYKLVVFNNTNCMSTNLALQLGIDSGIIFDIKKLVYL